jgi:hypothetical protein
MSKIIVMFIRNSAYYVSLISVKDLKSGRHIYKSVDPLSKMNPEMNLSEGT